MVYQVSISRIKHSDAAVTEIQQLKHLMKVFYGVYITIWVNYSAIKH